MRPLFDTSAFTGYKHEFTDSDYAPMSLSMVVWYELTATTIDASDWQHYEALRLQAAKHRRLLTPTMNDWRETAKLVARLRFQDKREGHGKTPPLSDATALQNDALMARAAYLHDCYVVTSNLKDFQRLQKFLKFTVISAAAYFAQ